jgi:hypothetical protein
MAQEISTSPFNPYARSLLGQNCENEQLAASVVNNNKSNFLFFNAMGIQSQLRNGSIKACKARATKAKHPRPLIQRSVRGGIAFVPSVHCKTCYTERLELVGKKGVTKSHKGHDPRCPRNRKTKGMSQQSTFVNKESERNLHYNNISPASIFAAQFAIKNNTKIEYFFGPRPKLPTMDSSSNQSHNTNGINLPIETQWNEPSLDDYSNIASSSTIRKIVDKRMEEYLAGKEDGFYNLKWLKNTKFPRPLMIAIDYIVNAIDHKKSTKVGDTLPQSAYFHKAMEKYHHFFLPGTCSFQLPPDVIEDGGTPSPYYHSISGELFFFVDWKLVCPAINLSCPNCLQAGVQMDDCQLRHDRTNFSKNKSVFPIWTHSGRPSLCVSMAYKCESCNGSILAIDGRILSMLPAHVRNAYPVEPTFASGAFHLHRDLTDDLEKLIKTYANGRFVGKKMHAKMGQQYTRKLETFLSQKPNCNFVSFNEFTSGFSAPSGAAIRQLYLSAYHSVLTPYGYSHLERNTRELQSVQVQKEDAISLDHTFQVVKNYKVSGAKAMLTINVGRTNEILGVALVKSTAMSQVSHMLTTMLKNRKKFEPSVLYHDTCPNLHNFFAHLFGNHLEQRLGLFHLMHRIVETLDNKCEKYWKAMVQLKNSIYETDTSDEAALLACLQDGTFSRVGKRYSTREIEDIRHSKVWKERFGPYLRKRILPGTTICHRLSQWVLKFKDAKDDMGCPLFG